MGPARRARRARDPAREAALPLARRRLRRLRRLAAARRRRRLLRRGDPRPDAAGVPTCSTARASRCGSGSRPSRPSSRRTSARRRRSSARSSTSDEDFALALEHIADLGARNVLITNETGCFALSPRGPAPRRFRAVAPQVEASRASARRRAARGFIAAPGRGPAARRGAAQAVAAGAASARRSARAASSRARRPCSFRTSRSGISKRNR